MKIKTIVAILLIAFSRIAWVVEVVAGSEVLTLNPTMHTDIMMDTAISPNKKYIATASKDRTAKIWEVRSGKLLHTLRFPINTKFFGYRDALSAVAFASNSTWVAVAGKQKAMLDNKNWIYIFEVSTGRLLHVIDEVPGDVSALCVSPDNSRIAATIENKGIKQWTTQDWQIISTDTDYGKQNIYHCAYTQDNHLLTSSTSDDFTPSDNNQGQLRLYEPSGVLKQKINVPMADHLWAISIHPNGKQFVVSQSNRTRLGFSIGNLYPLGIQQTLMPITKKTEQPDDAVQSIRAVSWSADGKQLYMGGYFSYKDIDNPLLSFDYHDLNKAPTALSGFPLIIIKIIPINKSELLVLTPNVLLKVNRFTGETSLYQESPIIQTHNSYRDFLTNANGQRIFLSHIDKEKNILIDLTQRLITVTDTPAWDFKTSIKYVPNWKDSDKPYFNNETLGFFEDKSQLVYAISGADGQHTYFVGGENRLFRFDETGKIVWQTVVNQRIRSIATPRNKQTVLTTQKDGTIKWYSFDNGKLLLSLFIDKQTLDWIAWTPDGEYDASKGGHHLIGLHTNRQINEAPIYQTAKQSKKFRYSPTLFERLFQQKKN